MNRGYYIGAIPTRTHDRSVARGRRWVRVDVVAAVAPERVALDSTGRRRCGRDSRAAYGGAARPILWEPSRRAGKRDHRLRPRAAARLLDSPVSTICAARNPRPSCSCCRRHTVACAGLSYLLAPPAPYRMSAALCFARSFATAAPRFRRAHPSEGPRAYADRAQAPYAHAARIAVSSSSICVLASTRRRRRCAGGAGRRGGSFAPRAPGLRPAAASTRGREKTIFASASCFKDSSAVLAPVEQVPLVTCNVAGSFFTNSSRCLRPSHSNPLAATTADALERGSTPYSSRKRYRRNFELQRSDGTRISSCRSGAKHLCRAFLP